MRIQHNVMAMNAYRNYSNNTSALSKNLERLSSGYKINRAGDDAAGLAISEKMRAQITGLEAAQKNVKDGISLVNTAEGAMQEVQDMLNRMVYLAQESANGTYDNDVDRANLQKEMDQLNAEIDRIADSANFNGIKLLDGSLDAGGETVLTEGKFTVANPDKNITGNLPAVGDILGTNTVLHKDAKSAGDATTFSVDLHNVEFSNENGKSIEITIGDTVFSLNGDDSGKLDAKGIADKFIADDFMVGATGSSTAIDHTSVTIGDGTFKVEADGTRLIFTQTDDKDITVPNSVKVEDPTLPAGTTGEDKFDAASTPSATTISSDLGGVDLSGTNTDPIGSGNADKIKGATLTVGDVTVDLSQLNITDTTSKADAQAAILAAANAAITAHNEAGAAGSVNYNKYDALVAADLNFTSTGVAAAAAGVNKTTAMTAIESAMTGDYNVSTTVIAQKGAAADKRLASTKFDLTADMVTDNSTITIGKETYTFTTDKNKIGKEGYVDASSGDLTTIASNLTKAAEKNGTYTVGHDTNSGRITITEVDGQKNFDLTTEEGIEKSLGFAKASVTEATGTALTLQIGDSSDSYNQLKVSIGDIHASALGTASLDISTQAGAQAAVDVIKAAINRVSTIRGTLGATSNRLDHTANNLSVMRENITDAESSIRDTDIAEEMMSYTKNNILVQSAQAMLAQANQVPQGVLQLLQ